jgi:hypothetical protein
MIFKKRIEVKYILSIMSFVLLMIFTIAYINHVFPTYIYISTFFVVFVFVYLAFNEKLVEISSDYIMITFKFIFRLKSFKINISDVNMCFISKGYGETPQDTLVIEYNLNGKLRKMNISETIDCGNINQIYSIVSNLIKTNKKL